MPLNVTLGFPTSASASAIVAAGLKVQRYELNEGLSELFELTLEVLSSDPAIDVAAIVGQPIVVDFGDEPFLKEIQGIVRRAVQHTSVTAGDSRYEWKVVPALWLTTRRRDHRIFQNSSVVAIVAGLLADPSYQARVAPPAIKIATPPPAREYCVQYGETDHEFISRILAEEGIASFFDHANGSTWTLTDDTSATTLDLTGAAIPFSDPSNLNPVLAGNPGAPHISAVEIASSIETSALTIRDYDFEKPQALLQATCHLAPEDTLSSEASLEAYTYELGWFRPETQGADQAVPRLEALRSRARTMTCQASFALPPGTAMTLTDHPRADANIPLLVVRARTTIVFGGTARHEMECLELDSAFRPARLPKRRIHGTQTAMVVGAAGEEIDVDSFGRVQVEFRWDRRDLHTGSLSRRVRVAQGWAGAGYGFVMLPRINDEVVIAYEDGDPDHPIIVGRVHNAVVTTPLNLPEQKTRSTWRSRSSPGGAGFNEIMMEDAAGNEKLSFHGHRDSQFFTGRNSSTVVGQSQSVSVGAGQSLSVGGDQSTKVAGFADFQVTGALALEADALIATIAHDVRTSSDNNLIHANVLHEVTAGTVQLVGEKEVWMYCGGASIVVDPGSITLKVGGSSIQITEGSIAITSAGAVSVNGAVVKLNC
ncbi:MAG: type VI secretion system tip protein TssI/VgrG [Byssovorax sp.]